MHVFCRVHYTFLNVTHYKLTHSHAVKKLKWFTPSVEQGSWENDFPAKGSFTNYVDKFLAFFDHLPPFVYSFYLLKLGIFELPTHLFL